MKVVTIPLSKAWKMRKKWAGPVDMRPKRLPSSMQRLTQSIKSKGLGPIEVDKSDFNKGFLTEGKHRLIVARKLGIKNIKVRLR